MTSASERPALPPDRLDEHAAWLARGRSGGGRLVLGSERVGGSLEGVDLRHAELESVDLAGVSLAGARLEGARLKRCKLERADLRRATLLDTRFEDCDLRRSQIAGATVARTGFLRCAFGDFGSQPIGKPDVRGPYVVVAPDVSHGGDASRTGLPAEIDARWFTAPAADRTPRRFAYEGSDGARYLVALLHMHLQWTREVGPRIQDRVGYQTFGQLLADGAPAPFGEALPREVETKLREAVSALAGSWTPESSSAP